MAKKVRFVDKLPVSAYGSNTEASTSVSASYATTALSASYATTASHALFAVSASHEVVKEVSSSHANTADVAGGLQGQPSIYVTNITASGDISSSGTTITENGNVKNNLTVGGNLDIADTIYHTGDSNTKIRFPENDTIAFNTSGDERLRISPDGNISSSNNLTINNITSSGNILLDEDQKIYFEADKNTYIESHASDSFRAVVNNRQMFLLDEDTGNRAVFGNGTKVFIGANNNHLPSNQLEVSGSVSVLGGGTAGGHITASGDISSSGTVTGLTGSFSHLVGNSPITVGSPVDFLFPFTASGNVSGSATSTASFGTYLGDGSQLSGISTTPFPFTGEAQITGSLIISGSNTGGGFSGVNPLTKLSIGGNPGETFDFVHTPAQNTGLEVLPQLLVISGSRALGENATIHIGSSNASTSNIGDNVVVRHALYVAGRFDHPNAAGNTGDERYAFAITGSDRNGTGGVISLGIKGVTPATTAIHLNGHLTASANVNISASATSTASFGTYFGDGSNLSNISTTPFPFTGEAQITGSLLLDSGSFTYQPNSGSSAAALGSFKIKGYDLTDIGERFFDVFTMDHVVEAEESTLVRPRILFKSALPQNSGGITTVFFGTGSEDRSAPSVNIHGEFAYSNATNNNFSVSGSSGRILFSSIIPLSTTTSTLGQSINRWNAIYAKTGSFSGNVSGSATSTASFGTYLGDGSQLSNISTTTFPFSGSAVITGSLTVSGSFVPHGNGPISNVVIGNLAAPNLTSAGLYNVYIGEEAGEAATNGDDNIAIGRRAGEASNNDNRCILIGFRAGGASTLGNDNIYIGYDAGKDATSTHGNIGIGRNALNTSDDGGGSGYNIAVGYYAGEQITSGNFNLFLGYNAGQDITTGANNIIIGSGSKGEAGITNQLRIGHGSSPVISASLETGDIIFANTASAPNFSGSFQGDGSQLTNLPASSTFPFTGVAQITGSILMTGSADEGQFITFDPVSGGDVSIGTGKNATYNGLEINTAAGKYVQIGAQNASYIHFYTNANNFYFNKPVHIAGNLYSSGQDFIIGRNAGTTDTITLGDNSIEFDLNSINMLFISSSHLISGSATSTASFGTYIGDGSQLSNISTTTFPFTGDAQITGSLLVSGSITAFDINMSMWTLGADAGNNYYYFTGPGDLGGTEQNPDIHLVRGQKYRFFNPMDAHPFQIQDTGGSAFNTGVTNNGVQLGFLSFDVPMDGPTHLKYQCTAHAAMVGNIYIADARIASGSFSGSFQGDGSNLTGVSAFPFNGDAVITGSLIVSQSGNPGLTVFSSGSTAFEVIGSVGTLFSVDDSLTGTVFSANDISGLPVLQADATGEVYLGKSPQSLYTTAVISATSASSTSSVAALSTSSYDGAFFDFTCISASNSTVGSIMSTWNGGTVTFNEHATSSIGTTYRTAGLDLQVIISSSQAQLVAITDSTAPNTWKIKTTIRAI